jgi:hypothetical protein
MLAWRMEHAREDGAERVSVLHISPSANQSLHKVTAPALRRFAGGAFDVFRTLLIQPDHFVSRTAEEVFNPTIQTKHPDPETAAWSEYLRDRYHFLAVARLFTIFAQSGSAVSVEPVTFTHRHHRTRRARAHASIRRSSSYAYIRSAISRMFSPGSSTVIPIAISTRYCRGPTESKTSEPWPENSAYP